MDEPVPGPRARSGSPARHVPAVLAGVSGCLLLVVWTSPRYADGLPSLEALVNDELPGARWWFVAIAAVATAVGLGALRWWPYLLVVSGLLAVPGAWTLTASGIVPLPADAVASAGYPLAIVGVLAAAQGLVRTGAGWGAVVTGLAVGAPLLGTTFDGSAWVISGLAAPAWQVTLVVVGLVGLLPAAWYTRHGDGDAIGLPDPERWSWQRIRPIVAGTLAMCVVIPLSFLTIERLSRLLDVSSVALYQYQREHVVTAMLGVITLVAASAAAMLAGPWTLAGALTAATARIAVVGPMALALSVLAWAGPVRFLGALAGVVLGVLAAGSRWRIPLAGALAVLAAATLFIGDAATSGNPFTWMGNTTPALLVLVLVAAAATAVTGATAPALAARGALPASVGPVAAVLAVGGLQAMEVTYVRDSAPVLADPVHHLTNSAVLLLMAGAAIGGLGYAQQLAVRRAERKQAGQIQREAAAAERNRLARPIHDGVLQVLALVQRHGSQLGDQGTRLAALAAEQEVALRALLSGDETAGHEALMRRRDGHEDLRTPLRSLGSPEIEVVTPAEPVVLPAQTVAEVTAAVQAALDNVRRHAGPGARAWLLLEDEGDAVRVTVRDNGIGFPPQRLAETAAAGRLGVIQSMRGRITDLDGTTTIHSRPDEGTEVEFWVPRPRTAGR